MSARQLLKADHTVAGDAVLIFRKACCHPSKTYYAFHVICVIAYQDAS
jgi:hypothetical protein